MNEVTIVITTQDKTAAGFASSRKGAADWSTAVASASSSARAALAGAGSSAASMGDSVRRAGETAGRGLEEAGRSAQQYDGFLRGALQTASGFVTGNLIMGSAAKAFSFAKEAVFGFNTELQNADIAFTTMLGSAKKSADFLANLKQFALATPFEFKDLVTASQHMLAMGVSAQKVIPWLTAAGDAAAALGMGKEGVDRITLALGQMNAKQQVSGGEMLQLTEAGIPAWGILAGKLHMTVAELQNLQMKAGGGAAIWTKLGGSLDPLIEGIEKGTTGVAGLGGMMDKQSHTMTGALSNVSDSLNQTISTAFKPFFDAVQRASLKLGDFMTGDSFKATMASVAVAVAAVMKQLNELGGWASGHQGALKAAAAAMTAMGAAMMAYKIATEAAAAAQWLLNLAMDANPVGVIIVAIIGLVAAVYYLWTHSEAFRKFFIGLWGQIWDFLKGVGHWFAHDFAGFFVTLYQKGIKPPMESIISMVKSVGNFFWSLGKVVEWLVTKIVLPYIAVFGAIFRWLYQEIIAPVVSFIVADVRVLGAIFGWLWTHAIWPALSAIADAAHWLWGIMKSIFGAVGGFIADAFGRAVEIVKGDINALISLLNNATMAINRFVLHPLNSVTGSNFGDIPQVPHLATGGITGSGWAVVGERGRELVKVGPGSQVMNNGATEALLGGGGAGGGGVARVEIVSDGSALGDLIVELLRPIIRNRGGNVQLILAGREV